MQLKNITVGSFNHADYFERKKMANFLFEQSRQIGLSVGHTTLLDAGYLEKATWAIAHWVINDLQNDVYPNVEKSQSTEARKAYDLELRKWKSIAGDCETLGNSIKRDASNSKRTIPATKVRVRSTYLNGVLVGQYQEDNSSTLDYTKGSSIPPSSIGYLSDLCEIGKKCSEGYLEYINNVCGAISGMAIDIIRSKNKIEVEKVQNVIDGDKKFFAERSSTINDHIRIFKNVMNDKNAPYQSRRLSLGHMKALKRSYFDNLWAAFRLANDMLEITYNHQREYDGLWKNTFPNENFSALFSDLYNAKKIPKNSLSKYSEKDWDIMIDRLNDAVQDAKRTGGASKGKMPFDYDALHSNLEQSNNDVVNFSKLVLTNFERIFKVGEFKREYVRRKTEKHIISEKTEGGVTYTEMYDPLTGRKTIRF